MVNNVVITSRADAKPKDRAGGKDDSCAPELVGLVLAVLEDAVPLEVVVVLVAFLYIL